MTARKSSLSRATPRPSEIEAAIERWKLHFEAAFGPDWGPADVEAATASVARDCAWIYHGGSGRRAMHVLFDDFVQAAFEFDPSDRLVSFSVFQCRADWLKGPGNVLVHGAPDGEELVLVEEQQDPAGDK